MGVQGAKPPAGARGVPHRRQLKGCRGLPAGEQGCCKVLFPASVRGAAPNLGQCPNVLISCAPPQAARKRGKRGFSGAPRTPQRGGCPFEPRSRVVKLTPKGVSSLSLLPKRLDTGALVVKGRVHDHPMRNTTMVTPINNHSYILSEPEQKCKVSLEHVISL